MRLPKDSVMDTPTIQRNVGKTVSVRVHPCHDEWLSGAYDFGPPGLFTITIRAMVAPRRASRATRRVAGGDETVPSEVSGLVTVATPQFPTLSRAKRSHERQAIPAGNVFGGRNLWRLTGLSKWNRS